MLPRNFTEAMSYDTKLIMKDDIMMGKDSIISEDVMATRQPVRSIRGVDLFLPSQGTKVGPQRQNGGKKNELTPFSSLTLEDTNSPPLKFSGSTSSPEDSSTGSNSDCALSESTLECIEKLVPNARITSSDCKTIHSPSGCAPPITPNTPCFTGMLMPVSSQTGGTASMMFVFKVREDQCLLQWKEFTGLMAGRGINVVTCLQSLTPLPKWKVGTPINVVYKGVKHFGRAEIDVETGRISFNLGVPPEQVQLQDAFTIEGGALPWIPSSGSCY